MSADDPTEEELDALLRAASEELLRAEHDEERRRRAAKKLLDLALGDDQDLSEPARPPAGQISSHRVASVVGDAAPPLEVAAVAALAQRGWEVTREEDPELPELSFSVIAGALRLHAEGLRPRQRMGAVLLGAVVGAATATGLFLGFRPAPAPAEPEPQLTDEYLDRLINIEIPPAGPNQTPVEQLREEIYDVNWRLTQLANYVKRQLDRNARQAAEE